ncbi:MAG: TrbI/VirB10 family protein [Pseudohongiella sp.]|nr:TrbI/VirB10 family protein [Pseudohongiella sp.]
MTQSNAIKQADHTDEKPAGQNQKLMIGLVAVVVIVLVASIVRSVTAPNSSQTTLAEPTQERERSSGESGALRSFLGATQTAPAESRVQEPSQTNGGFIAPTFTTPISSNEDQHQYVLMALQSDINGNVTIEALESGTSQMPVPVMNAGLSTGLGSSDVGVRAAELRTTIARLEEANRRASAPGYSEANVLADLSQMATQTQPSPVPEARSATAKLLPPGALIQSVLSVELNSDVSSTFSAMVKYPVYDTRRENILIPTGSRLYGRLGSGRMTNEIIQQRVTLQVQGVVLPNDQIIDLSNAAGLDVNGAGGVQGSTESHFWARTLGTFGYAVLSVGPGLTVSNGDPESSIDQATGAAVEQFSENFVPLANQYASLVPTKTIPIGTPINVVVEVPIYVEPFAPVAHAVDFGGAF